MSRLGRLTFLAVAVAAAGCSDPDPLSKSHDIVARAAGHDLTAPELKALMARAKTPVASTVENGALLANLWADYHRLAYAAAHGDSLSSHLEAALAPVINLARVNMLLAALRQGVPRDTASKAAFDTLAHGLYAVRHIFFAFPLKATKAQKDSVAKLALSVRPQLTPANFAAMAKKYSADTASASKGGLLGIIPKGAVNPAVAKVITALQPDSISGALRTPAGVDIIQRASYEAVVTEYAAAYSRATTTTIDSTLIAKMATAGALKVESSAPSVVRDAASNPFAGARDSTVIATYDKGGKFTAADLITWVNLMESGARSQVFRDLPQQSDAVVTTFVRNVASRGLLLRAADSAKMVAPDSIRTRFSAQFRNDLVRMWKLLGVSPEQLADSAKTVADREQFAARSVDRFLERGMSGELILSPVAVPIEVVLNAKYPAILSIPAVSKVMMKQ